VNRTFAVGMVALFILCPAAPGAEPLTLEQRLQAEDPDALVKRARTKGDPARGAALFHSPQLACTKCHSCGSGSATLGPDLSRLEKETTGRHLVESILYPSKEIKKGFESVTVVTKRGATLTGLLVEESRDTIVLRDLAQDGKLVRVPRADVEEHTLGTNSIMPSGLVNGLENRNQFIDLLRFLMEVAEKGPVKARLLQPATITVQLPAYENDLDHAGLIADLDQKSFERGKAIYNLLCVTCHGTRDKPGTMPTSLRFASGKFRNGSDPYRMYRTVTDGFGLMTAQSALVPQQKYDVIHYIREAYLARDNPSQYTKVDMAYLAGLPRGKKRGPEAKEAHPWSTMDYGPSLMGTFEVGNDGKNIAYKGIAVRLDSGPGGVAAGNSWALYEHDTMRLAAAWTGKGFIDWNGINFNGQHEIHPRIVGKVHVANTGGPGWADPNTGSFEDRRLVGRDGRRYGPLPRQWLQFRGLFHQGEHVAISYTVGARSILETPRWESDGNIFTRTLRVGPGKQRLLARLAPMGTAVALVGEGATLSEKDGYSLLDIPPGERVLTLQVMLSDGNADALKERAKKAPPKLEDFEKGGTARYPTIVKTAFRKGPDVDAFAVDELMVPTSNPWHCQTRLTGFDFLAGGDRVAVCTWDGDVWMVSGLNDPAGELTWRRIASGLFQPLGLKVVDGRIYVSCRDQICILRDLNGDGETDYYECFNTDHQVTEHFHEFAMGLQIDAEGNFYYAKSACHARPAVVPHHGTLLRVEKDGSKTTILARGFRAANGVCVNGDGTFYVTDQEGHWTPKNRINLVRQGGFYGNMLGYHDVTDSSDRVMEQPVCWITNSFDRSPGELMWVDSPAWGPLKGALLNFSYGMGKIFVVLPETVDGKTQGGMIELPLPVFATGVMRGRLQPGSGHLYTCGMYAWAGNQQKPGGFYRVRLTNRPIQLPVRMNAWRNGLALTFSDKLDPAEARSTRNYLLSTWALKRTANYGSPHVGVKEVTVSRASLSEDGRTVFLTIPDLKPNWCMEIGFVLRSASGEPVVGVIDNTVHTVREQAYPER
jgi:putative heme-binding domain-containing protein